MRLSHNEKTAIINAFNKMFPKESFELFLFGSRSNDHKKGGDIDLLVLTNENNKSMFTETKVKVKLEIFKTIDEQRIDITVATPEEIESDIFLKSIQPSMIKLL